MTDVKLPLAEMQDNALDREEAHYERLREQSRNLDWNKILEDRAARRRVDRDRYPKKPGYVAEYRRIIPVGSYQLALSVLCPLCSAPAYERCSGRRNPNFSLHHSRYLASQGVHMLSPQLAFILRSGEDCGVCYEAVCSPSGFHYYKVAVYFDNPHDWAHWLRKNEGIEAVKLDVGNGSLKVYSPDADSVLEFEHPESNPQAEYFRNVR